LFTALKRWGNIEFCLIRLIKQLKSIYKILLEITQQTETGHSKNESDLEIMYIFSEIALKYGVKRAQQMHPVGEADIS
jgi:hypothetical protein